MDVTAELSSDGGPVVGRQILVQIGGSSAFGVTGPDGRVTVPISLNSTPGPMSITASFDADETFAGSGDGSAFTIARAPSSLSTISPFATTSSNDHAGILTTLGATRGSAQQPLMSHSVTVSVSGPVNRTLSIITDYLGRVRLPLDLPAGTYGVTVGFAGNETYLPTSASATTAVIAFEFLSPVDDPPTVNVVKAGSTVPIKFSLGGNHGLGVLAGTPVAVKFDCETGVPQDELEQTTTSSSGLTFSGGLYQYNWKTAKSARGCFRFELRLGDGSTHVALFRLR